MMPTAHVPGMQHPPQWREDLNPEAMAGANYGTEGPHPERDARTAFDYKDVHRSLAGFSDDELRSISRENLGARLPLYLRSRLSLTEFGEAVVAHEEDFSRHNPIDRWWGGTRLTNDHLWRWNPVLVAP